MVLTTSDRLRSQTIQRWHTVQTSFEQSVASHSHCVGIIAEALVDVLSVDVSIEDRYWILKFAQVHDLPEIIQGDMSSVYKRFLESNLVGFKELQQSIEESLIPELKHLSEYCAKRPILQVICKLADIIEAYTYFTKAQSGDKQHNNEVLGKLERNIANMVDTARLSYPGNWNAVSDFVKSMVVPDEQSAIIQFEKCWPKIES